MINSPYEKYLPQQWYRLCHDEKLSLSEEEIVRLRGFNETLSREEVKRIYLPLSKLMSLYVSSTQDLYQASCQLMGTSTKVPYIIGVAGSVAVGKSTTSRILQALLSRWPSHPKVALLSTDNFLYPNVILEERNLRDRKGFPESFDLKSLIHFLWCVKSGEDRLEVPVYSHEHYDILPGKKQCIERPDILILEGLNVLQKRTDDNKGNRIFVADFIDFSIFVDADLDLIRTWYLQRFAAFRSAAKQDPSLYFHRFSKMSDREAEDYAKQVWYKTNEANLCKNILPDKYQARLILQKGPLHKIESVLLRKL